MDKIFSKIETNFFSAFATHLFKNLLFLFTYARLEVRKNDRKGEKINEASYSGGGVYAVS